MHSSLVVAKRLLLLAGGQQQTLTPMQLLKLVYICHGFSLGLYGRPLISDSAEAWKFGPVIPDLYHAIKHFRSKPVDVQVFKSIDDTALSEDESSLIAVVFKKYGRLTGIQLSSLTHTDDSPWHYTWHSSGGTIISDDIIQEYYRRLIENHAAAAA